MPCRYIWALYWSFVTLATVGYGDLHAYCVAEAAFSIVYIMFSLVLNAFILGKLDGHGFLMFLTRCIAVGVPPAWSNIRL